MKFFTKWLTKFYLQRQIIVFLSILFHWQMGSAFIIPETLVRFRTSDPTTITDLSTQAKQEVVLNTDTDLTVTAPLQFEVKGHLPVILIPIKSGLTEIKLNPPSYKEAIRSYGQKEMSLFLSTLMIDVQGIQKLIQRRELGKALSKVDELQTAYADLAFFNFLRGSILFLQGKKNDAREAVKKGLEAHPDYEEGKAFLKNLGEDPNAGVKK